MNIAIICSNYIFRDSLKTILGQIADFNILFDSSDIQDFRNNPDANKTDLVLIDGGSENAGYYRLIESIHAYSAQIKVLILTDPNEHCHLVQQTELNSTGLLPKNSRKKEIETIIRSLTDIDQNKKICQT